MTTASMEKAASNQLYLKEHKLKALKLLDQSRAENTNRTYKPKQDEFIV
jgi:hypothetical protein